MNRFAALGLAALFALSPLAAPLSAHESHAQAAHSTVTHGALEIAGAFTRATLPGAPVGGGYLTITNTGDEDDRLVDVIGTVSDRVEIHEMAVVNDVMTMRQLPDGLPVPAGETVTLAPGGFHLMFMQLNTSFIEGETVTVTLVFEKAGAVDVALKVQAPGARSASGEGHDGDHGDHGDQEEQGHQGHSH